MASATFSPAAREIADTHISYDHCRITVGRAGSFQPIFSRRSSWSKAARSARPSSILCAPSQHAVRCLTFNNSRRICDELDYSLLKQNFPVTSIHSERSQHERVDAIRAFRKGDMPIMIATDAAGSSFSIINSFMSGWVQVAHESHARVQFEGLRTYYYVILRLS